VPAVAELVRAFARTTVIKQMRKASLNRRGDFIALLERSKPFEGETGKRPANVPF
jgi:hypothetical protein